MSTVPTFSRRHLLGIEGLSAQEIESLLDLAEAEIGVSRQIEKKKAVLRGRTQINLFFEASTRTQSSFELAGKRLGVEWDCHGLTAVATDNIAGSIAAIEKAFRSFFPDGTWRYRFLDEDFQQMYLEERRAGRVVTSLALMAVLIACLGLFGLASFVTTLRTKEIGIRKVMGASVPGVVPWLAQPLQSIASNNEAEKPDRVGCITRFHQQC